MEGRKVHLGQFVREQGSALAPAKVVAIDGENVTIEYFWSISKRSRTVVSTSTLDPYKVSPRTRCYVPTEDEGWRMGFIKNLPDPASPDYYVQFPNGSFDDVSPANLYVRISAPVEDPLETLIYHAHETPFFHEHRVAFLRSLTDQRAASRGLSGILSSAVELRPHQVDVVRRVLEDSVPRYLLADEVGLGKTIEAGMILRQFLLDHPWGRALIVVPRPLVVQWESELTTKFLIADFLDAEVSVIAHEELTSGLVPNTVDFLIIDEAHRVAEGSLSPDTPSGQAYGVAARLARQASHLLLLSATPIRRNERSFLAMLHLLDPALYSLDDVASFRERVEKRQEIGQALMAFTEMIAGVSFLIEDSLDTFAATFPHDDRLRGLCDELRALVGVEDEQQAAVDATANEAKKRLIRTIRTHLSETYRLHQRMLRYRREGIAGNLVRGRQFGEMCPDLDFRRDRVDGHLELWRQMLALAIEEEHLNRTNYGHLAQRIFEGFGSDLSVLEGLVRVRLAQDGSDEVLSLPLFNGERSRLEVILDELARPVGSDRIEAFLGWMHKTNRPSLLRTVPKVVAFSSHRAVVEEIGRRLSAIYPRAAFAVHHGGLTAEEQEQAVAQFRDNPHCALLICDRSAEEGKNFQFADKLVHIDLPWDPNRVEQRLGRVDRYGRGDPVPSIVIADQREASIPHLWFRVLRDGYGIFDNSMSALQHLIEDEMEEVRWRLLYEGVVGLEAYVDIVRDRVKEEFRRTLAQDQLDAIQMGGAQATEEFVGRMYDCEATDISGVTDHWFTQVLHFDVDRYRGANGSDAMVRYRADPHRTLVPWTHLAEFFMRHLEHPATYSRMAAVRNPGSRLLRVGQPLIDAMHNYIRVDDRGQAFALWRYDPIQMPGEDLIALRFTYLIEADLDHVQRQLEATRVGTLDRDVLQRRADAFFPPIMLTVWIDDRYRPVTEAEVIQRLEQPYDQKRDTNLSHERLGPLHALIPQSSWEEFCRKSARLALAEAQHAANLRQRVAEAAERARLASEAKLEQLRLRRGFRDLLVDRTDDLERESAIAEALQAGILAPSIRLDSVGCVILSPDDPFRPLMEGNR